MIIDPHSLGRRRRARRRLRRLVIDALHTMRRHGAPMTLVFVIWCFAFVRLCIDPTPHMPLLFNWTPSLPYTIAHVQYGNGAPFARGDYIVYSFNGDAQRRRPGLHAQPFFKQIRGVPGDRITVTGHTVCINGIPVGVAKPATADGQPLAPIAAMVIPSGFYYVQGSHADSFDSRYRDSGLVRAHHILARVTPWF